jgi:hypothetical protein
MRRDSDLHQMTVSREGTEMSSGGPVDKLFALIRGRRRIRRRGRRTEQPAFVVSLVLVLLCVLSATALGVSNAVPYPDSMAAIGDSLTFDNNLLHPPNSWSTGANPAVNSHYLRILAANPAIKGKSYDFTTQDIDLRAEAREAVAKSVDYVTIGPIEDDTCNGISAAKVAAKLDGALRLITARLPSARVLVVSTRDIARLIGVLDQDQGLRGFTVCQTQVGAGVAALARLHHRFVAVNEALAQACGRYRQCRFDRDAVFTMPLTRADIASGDNFSLSAAGNRRLAAVTWKATFAFAR